MLTFKMHNKFKVSMKSVQQLLPSHTSHSDQKKIDLKHKLLHFTRKTWYQAAKVIFMHWEGIIFSKTKKETICCLYNLVGDLQWGAPITFTKK